MFGDFDVFPNSPFGDGKCKPSVAEATLAPCVGVEVSDTVLLNIGAVVTFFFHWEGRPPNKLFRDLVASLERSGKEADVQGVVSSGAVSSPLTVRWMAAIEIGPVEQ